MISVELKVSGKVETLNSDNFEVEIFCNKEGLKKLISELQNLGENDHVHLSTPSWGGNELDESINGNGNVKINHIVISVKD